MNEKNKTLYNRLEKKLLKSKAEKWKKASWGGDNKIQSGYSTNLGGFKVIIGYTWEGEESSRGDTNYFRNDRLVVLKNKSEVAEYEGTRELYNKIGNKIAECEEKQREIKQGVLIQNLLKNPKRKKEENEILYDALEEKLLKKSKAEKWKKASQGDDDAWQGYQNNIGRNYKVLILSKLNPDKEGIYELWDAPLDYRLVVLKNESEVANYHAFAYGINMISELGEIYKNIEKKQKEYEEKQEEIKKRRELNELRCVLLGLGKKSEEIRK